MATYILRDLPPDVWARFKERSEREGWPLSALFIELMREYGDGHFSLVAPPPSRPSKGFVKAFLEVPCANGHPVRVAFSRLEGLTDAQLDSSAVASCGTCRLNVFLRQEDRDAVRAWRGSRNR